MVNLGVCGSIPHRRASLDGIYKGYFDYYNQSQITSEYPNGKNIRTCYQIIPTDQVPAQAVLF